MSETYRIYPAPLSGAVEIPASRSVLQRAVLAAALGGGASYLEGNLLLDREVTALLEGAGSLGAVWRRTESGLEIIGMRRGEDKGRWAEKFSTQSWRLRTPEQLAEREAPGSGGTAGQLSPGFYIPGGKRGDLPVIDCRDAASVFPLLLPLALVRRGGGCFTGLTSGESASEDYREILHHQEIAWLPAQDNTERKPAAGLSGLTVAGRLKAGVFTFPGDTDPLLPTGFLFALPFLKEDSTLLLEQPLAGADELDLGIRLIGDFGAEVSRQKERQAAVPGRQRLQSRYYQVEGSYRQAAFYLTAGALGQDVEVKGLAARSLQRQRRIFDFLETLGCRLVQGARGGVKMEPADGGPGGFPFLDCGAAPSLIPLLTLAAALTPGERVMMSPKDCPEAENRRIQAAVDVLAGLGAEINRREKDIWVRGREALAGGNTADSRGSGRLAMLIAIAAGACRQPVTLTGAEAAERSWPGFWEEYRRLGGRLEKC